MEPGQLDRWAAYLEIEPSREDRIIEILKLGFASLCRALGAEIKPSDLDPAPAEQTREQSPDEAVAMVRATMQPASYPELL